MLALLPSCSKQCPSTGQNMLIESEEYIWLMFDLGSKCLLFLIIRFSQKGFCFIEFSLVSLISKANTVKFLDFI